MIFEMFLNLEKSMSKVYSLKRITLRKMLKEKRMKMTKGVDFRKFLVSTINFFLLDKIDDFINYGSVENPVTNGVVDRTSCNTEN